MAESIKEDRGDEAHACSVLFSVLAEALINEPAAQVTDEVGQVARAMGRDELSVLPDPEALKQSYYNRFAVPTSPTYVPLVESSIVHMRETEEGIAYGPLSASCSDHVAGCYAAVGFDPAALAGDRLVLLMAKPDSLAVELAFVAYLKACESEAATLEAAARCADLAAQFVREHLGRWVDSAAACLRASDDDFYAALCAFAAEAVDANFR